MIILLGLAALLADGFSMAAGAYLGTKSEREFIENERCRAIDTIVEAPEEAKEQTVQLLEKKGVPSTLRHRFVRLISGNRRLWRDFLVSQEQGLTPPESSSPMTNGLATFLALAAAGFVPLVFLLMPAEVTYGATFLLSAVATAIALFVLGAVRARVTQGRELHSGLEVLPIGGIAAGFAFAAGFLLQG